MRRRLLLNLAFAAGLAGPAAAQGRHWLIGTWRGTVLGGNAQRTLRVAAVGADGKVDATWGGEAVQATLRGEELSFTTPNGPVTLTRGADGNLSGTVPGGRRAVQIVMTKQ